MGKNKEGTEDSLYPPCLFPKTMDFIELSLWGSSETSVSLILRHSAIQFITLVSELLRRWGGGKGG